MTLKNNDSILTDVKKLLGIQKEYTHFDQDILIHINTALSTIFQLGYPHDVPHRIASEEDTWETLLGEQKEIESIKTLIYLKVRLVFDPPTNSFTIEAIKNIIAELEWRLNVTVDKGVVYE